MPSTNGMSLEKLRLPPSSWQFPGAPHAFRAAAAQSQAEPEADSDNEWSTSCSEASDDEFPSPSDQTERLPNLLSSKAVWIAKAREGDPFAEVKISNPTSARSITCTNAAWKPQIVQTVGDVSFVEESLSNPIVHSARVDCDYNTRMRPTSSWTPRHTPRPPSARSTKSTRAARIAQAGEDASFADLNHSSTPFSSRSTTLSSAGAEHYSLSSRVSMEDVKDTLEAFASRLARVEDRLQDPADSIAQDTEVDTDLPEELDGRSPPKFAQFTFDWNDSELQLRMPHSLDGFNMTVRKLGLRLDQLEGQLRQQGCNDTISSYEDPQTLEVLSTRVDLMEIILNHQMSAHGEIKMMPPLQSSFLLQDIVWEPGEEEQSFLSRTRTIALCSAGSTVTGAASGATVGVTAGGVIGAAIGVVPAVFTLGLSIPVFSIIGAGTGLWFGAGIGGTVGMVRGGVVGFTQRH